MGHVTLGCPRHGRRHERRVVVWLTGVGACVCVPLSEVRAPYGRLHPIGVILVIAKSLGNFWLQFSSKFRCVRTKRCMTNSGTKFDALKRKKILLTHQTSPHDSSWISSWKLYICFKEPNCRRITQLSAAQIAGAS